MNSIFFFAYLYLLSNVKNPWHEMIKEIEGNMLFYLLKKCLAHSRVLLINAYESMK